MFNCPFIIVKQILTLTYGLYSAKFNKLAYGKANEPKTHQFRMFFIAANMLSLPDVSTNYIINQQTYHYEDEYGNKY